MDVTVELFDAHANKVFWSRTDSTMSTVYEIPGHEPLLMPVTFIKDIFVCGTVVDALAFNTHISAIQNYLMVKKVAEPTPEKGEQEKEKEEVLVKAFAQIKLLAKDTKLIDALDYILTPQPKVESAYMPPDLFRASIQLRVSGVHRLED